MQVIPCRTDSPFYEFEVELDGVVYGLEFKWNHRDSAWYMTIVDSTGVLLAASRKVVIGVPLLRRFQAPGLPAGSFIALDTSGRGVDPGIDELGDRVILVYQ